MTTQVADLGQPESWPPGVSVVVDEIVSELRSSMTIESDFPACDLALGHPDLAEEAEEALRLAFDDTLIAAYHASRYLPHEINMVREEGLATVSEALIRRRLDAVIESYPALMSADDAALIERSGPLRWQTNASRLGLLWVVSPIETFLHESHGFLRLLGKWGGETIYWTRDDEGSHRPAAEVIDRVTAASTPTIVEVGVLAGDVPTWRRLWPTLVGTVLGLDDPWTEWGQKAAVPPKHILDVIQPDSERWPETLSAD